MENFRLFLIRLLQVFWLITVGFAVFAIFIEGFNTAIYLMMLGGIPLIILQFLIFASFNPLELFNGSTKESLLN